MVWLPEHFQVLTGDIVQELERHMVFIGDRGSMAFQTNCSVGGCVADALRVGNQGIIFSCRERIAARFAAPNTDQRRAEGAGRISYVIPKRRLTFTDEIVGSVFGNGNTSVFA